MAIADIKGFIQLDLLRDLLKMPKCLEIVELRTERVAHAVGPLSMYCRVELPGVEPRKILLSYLYLVRAEDGSWCIDNNNGERQKIETWIEEMMQKIRCPHCYKLYPVGLGDRRIEECENGCPDEMRGLVAAIR